MKVCTHSGTTASMSMYPPIDTPPIYASALRHCGSRRSHVLRNRHRLGSRHRLRFRHSSVSRTRRYKLLTFFFQFNFLFYAYTG